MVDRAQRNYGGDELSAGGAEVDLSVAAAERPDQVGFSFSNFDFRLRRTVEDLGVRNFGRLKPGQKTGMRKASQGVKNFDFRLRTRTRELSQSWSPPPRHP